MAGQFLASFLACRKGFSPDFGPPELGFSTPGARRSGQIRPWPCGRRACLGGLDGDAGVEGYWGILPAVNVLAGANPDGPVGLRHAIPRNVEVGEVAPAIYWGRELAFVRGFIRAYRAAAKLFRPCPPQAALAMGGFSRVLRRFWRRRERGWDVPPRIEHYPRSR